jgi:hypothetical protein
LDSNPILPMPAGYLTVFSFFSVVC